MADHHTSSRAILKVDGQRVWRDDHWWWASREIVDEGLGLLLQLSPAEQPPQSAIALMRLARDLGQGDWLAEHATPLLQSLPSPALEQLRPTDIDWLRHVISDEGLLNSLTRIEQLGVSSKRLILFLWVQLVAGVSRPSKAIWKAFS
ncbi:hypothetical protein, partial [Streptomyces sp. NPDC050422]|uniref:hypothetical protein n=1 Tax=Streptomyces sp. NPDC050422 TaxID=3365614 RepID=UPI0037A09E12